MKKLVLMLLALLAVPALCQTTNVIATITGQNGVAYANGTYSIHMVSSTGQDLTSSLVYVGSIPIQVLASNGGLDAFGRLNVNLISNSVITSPVGTQWQFGICSQTPTPGSLIPPQRCFIGTFPITGTTLDLTTQLSALAPPIGGGGGDTTVTFGSGPPTGQCATGNSYYDTANNFAPYICGTDFAWHPSGGGSGGTGNITYDHLNPETPLTTRTIVAGGESTMAGSPLMTSSHPAVSGPPFEAGPLGDQDLLSAILRKPQFSGRYAYTFNSAIGGHTCAQTLTDYDAQNVNNFAPGGSSAPNATEGLYVLLTGKNDQQQNTSLASFMSCMQALVQKVTTAGFTPLILASYNSPELPQPQIALMDQYNSYIDSLRGSVVNGQTVHVIDLYAGFPISSDSPDFVLPANINAEPNGAWWRIASYQITQTGSAPNQTSSVTLNLSGSNATTIMAGFPGLNGNPGLQIGGFNTTVSQYLNNAYADYVSGGGTLTITATLRNTVPSTGLVTDAGFIYVTNQTLTATSPEDAGLHMGGSGNENLANFTNDQWSLSGLGTAASRLNTVNIFSPPDGHISFANTALCVVNGYITTGVAAFCNSSIPAGDVIFSSAPSQNSPSHPGFKGGDEIMFIGDTSTFIRVLPGGTSFGTAITSADPTSLGWLDVANVGSGYVVGDTGTVGGAGANSGAYSVVAVMVNGICTAGVAGTTGALCPNSETQRSLQVNPAVGGTGYAVAAGVATTATTGSGTGLTVNVHTSVSSPLTIQAAGVDVQGGGIGSCGRGVPCPAFNDLGDAQFLDGGPINSTGSTVGFPGSGYPVPGPTVLTVVQPNSASGGTFNGTGANGVPVTFSFDATSCGSTTLCGTGYTPGTWPTTGTGSCTGTFITIASNGTFPGGVVGSAGYTASTLGSGCTTSDKITVVESGASGLVLDVNSIVNGGINAITFASAGNRYTSTRPYLTGDPTTCSACGGTGALIKVGSVTANAGKVSVGGATMIETGALMTINPIVSLTIPKPFLLSGLAIGQCLQTSTGGLITTTGSACGSSSGGITALTGDATASGSGSVPITFATVNSNVGTCGDATHVGQVTLNAKGLTTACTPVAITGSGGSGISGATSGQALIAGSATTATSSVPLAGAGPALTTGPNSGVTAGDLALFTGTAGQITDGAIAGSNVATLSGTQTFTGLKTFSAGINLPSTTAPLQFAGSAGSSGQCAISGGTGVTPSWGSCATGSSGISGQAAGVIPLGSTATTIGGQSHIDDGNTTAATITSAEPVVAPSFATNGSANGALQLTATGTPPGAAPTNTVQIEAPNSVTAYRLQIPGAVATAGNTFLSCTAASPSVCTWAAGSGGDTITSPNSTLNVGGTSSATTLDFNLAHSNIWTSLQTFSAAGAASTNSVAFSGTWFTGGSGTTTFPNVYISPAGTTAPTTYLTTGTGLGINGPTGCGNLIDGRVNGGNTFFGVTCGGVISGFGLTISGNISASGNATAALVSSAKYATATNCAGVGTSASPSVVTCAAAAAGAFSCATTASAATCTVNTTAVTANSEIIVTEVASESTRLGVTCNTTPSSVPLILLASKVAATSFTINMPSITTNPACFTFLVVN